MNQDLITSKQQEVQALRQNAISYIQDVCGEFGLHGTITSYGSSLVPESDRNHEYILASLNPLPTDETLPDPEDVLRRSGRSDKFFYPHIWAYDLSENDSQLRATDAMVEYCKKARFLQDLFSNYDTPLPTVLRVSEVNQLQDAWDTLHHPNANPSLQAKLQKDLSEFFKREQDPGKQEWLKYYRSDRYPDGKGSVSKVQGFLKRGEQEVDMDQLLEFNGDIRKLELQEHEYRFFRQLMAKHHPEVTYSVGKKEIVDHGLENRRGDSCSPFGYSVTGEEYATIRKDHFAEEGWSALADLRMAYWEYRDICYRAVDEPLVAGIYQKITLEYAKCNPIHELLSNGSMHLVQVPIDDFMNFVSLAKANYLRFYIDTEGIYAVPSLDYVNVIYNENQMETLEDIITRMMHDKVTYSHMGEHLSLQDRLAGIQSTAAPLHRTIPERNRG